MADGTFTPRFSDDNMTDMTATPVRLPAAATSTETGRLDPALAVLSAAAQAIPSALCREPTPSWLIKQECRRGPEGRKRKKDRREEREDGEGGRRRGRRREEEREEEREGGGLLIKIEC